MTQYKQLHTGDSYMTYPSIYVIVVTFNPRVKDLFNNISRFCESVNKIFLVDNSDNFSICEQIKSKAKNHSNIVYRRLESNNGIGSAQNEAVRYLIDNKYDDDDLLLFFDQDSYIEKGQLLDLANHLILEKKKNKKVIMLGATANSSDSEVGTTVASHIISSGSIVSLGDFKKIGYFDEELLLTL